MFKFTILLVTIWLQTSSCRRLSNSRSNNIFHRPKNWIKITSSPPPVVTGSFGGRIEVDCEVSGSPPPIVQWLKGGIPLIENEGFEMNALIDTPTSGLATVNAKLVIPSILSIDDDEYTCLAKSGSQIATKTTRIYLQDIGNITHLFGEEILSNKQPARIVLHAATYMSDIGTSVVLPCKSVGNPRPSVVWTDSSGQVLESGSDPRITVVSNGDLMITSIRWADMGPYTCTARNDVAEDTLTTFLYPMLPKK